LEACGSSVAPHNPLGPIATAAAIHFALVTPNWLIQEAIRSDVPWRNAVVGGGLPVEHGYISLPTAPGLGIEVDEDEMSLPDTNILGQDAEVAEGAPFDILENKPVGNTTQHLAGNLQHEMWGHRRWLPSDDMIRHRPATEMQGGVNMNEALARLQGSLDQMQMIDLSHTLEPDIPSWPTHAKYCHSLMESYTLGEVSCHYQLSMSEHTGTDTDLHDG